MANSTALTLVILTTLLSLFIPLTLSATNVLYSETKLSADQQLTYRNSALIMQSDCNLVLYADGIPVWHTNTAHKARSCNAWLESNGELIVFGLNDRRFRYVVWRSGVKSTKGNYALVLKFDATIHVYGPSLWTNSGAPITTDPNSLMSIVPSTIDSTLWTGDVAPIGTTIANNEYKLELLESCNMTLSNTKTGQILWHTNTTDFLRDCFVNIEGNGEFKIKYLGGATLWSSGAQGPSPREYVLVLRSDGKLVVYGPSIWSSLIKSGSEFGEKIAMVTQV